MLTRTVRRQALTVTLMALIALVMGITNSYGQGKNIPPDTTKPTVIATNPIDTFGVYTNSKIVATFSEAMDSTTITTATFTLMKGITPVAGVVTYSSFAATATFAPDSLLDTSAVYTATLTTGVTDTVGNPLDSAYVWNFTTGILARNSQTPLVLGTAGNYVILAKSGITTTPGTAIVGNIGVSPILSGAITGFGTLPYGDPPNNTYATSPLVTGNIYAPDFSEPTPTNLGVAVLAMQAAYDTAALRSLPDFTELYAGDISGKTLVPGLYKWGTGLMINGVTTTLAGDSNDVWVFQIAGTMLVGNAAILNLSRGAQPKNIFWQVAGQTTLGTTSQFKGIILDATAVVVMTGATLNGRALAQTAVTLDAATIGISGPTGVEQGISSVPAYGKLQLSPCWPNPSSGAISFKYVLPRSGNVSLNVYDICGRKVHTLVQGQQPGGAYNVTWRGDDGQGRLLPSSVYFYRLNCEGTSVTRRLVLLR